MKSSETPEPLDTGAVEQPVVKDLGIKLHHTPGPWTFIDSWPTTGKAWSHVSIRQQSNGHLSRLGCTLARIEKTDSPAWISNARLIAAAPELLQEARALLAKLDAAGPHLYDVCLEMHIRGRPYSGPTFGNEKESLRAAVLKATGELHAKPESVTAPDVAEAGRQGDPTDRRVRASSAGGEEP